MRTSLIAGAVMYAIMRGVPMEQVTAATGLRPDDLVDEDGWLPEQLMPALWSLIAAACPGEAVALDMAARAPLSAFGPLAHVCRHAETTRAALDAFIRYRFVLSDNLHMRLVEGDGEARVLIQHPMDAHDGGLAAEMGVALGIRIGREMIGVQPAVARVEFTHEPFGPRAAYAAFFEVPVRFGAERNAIVFDADALDQPTAQPNPALFEFIEAHLVRVRERMAEPETSGELARIRAAVAANAERSEYGAEALARRVGVSLRKLQRMTRAHDTTVRALLEEAREANARQLLGDHTLSVEQVSFLLGYAEDRAFRRAFKRWTGQTPAQLRRAVQSAQGGPA